MASNIAFTVRYRASSKFNVDALLKRSFVDVLNANRNVLLPSKGQKCIN